MFPKYRFPEFLQLKEWRVDNLGSVTYAVSRKNTKSEKYPIYSINNKEGFLPQAEQFEGVDSNSRGYDISLYKMVDKNTFAYNPARINVGSIGYSGELHDIIISSLYVCFKTNDKMDDKFFQHFLSTSIFNQQVENKAEGGIRSYLFYDNFSKILSAFPDIREQQKIADCLTSLDELITAENKKLEMLKTHKKGLMQKLFPAEDKIVPEWRFPEFKDSGDWEKKRLEQCLRQLPDYGINAPAVPYSNTLPTYLRITDISEDGRFIRSKMVSVDKNVTDNNYLEKGDIVFARTGASVGKSYKYNENDGKLVFAGFLIRIKPDFSKVNPELLFQFLSTDQYWQWVNFTSTRSGQPGINSNEYSSMPIILPNNHKEQQKIADCLSSLYELITSQAEKIETLKLHKKGLMQGLFPSAQEVIE